MSRLHRDDVGTPIEDAGCAKRILVNLAVGVAAGALGAWGMLVFRRGGSTDPRRNPAVLFSGLLLDVAPLTAGGAALYTVTSCTLEANRGAKDWRNSAAGGALAGALVLGVKQRSAPAALVGALLFATAAAGPDLLGMMNATPAEFDAKVPSALGGRAASPTDFAANAAQQRIGSASRLA